MPALRSERARPCRQIHRPHPGMFWTLDEHQPQHFGHPVRVRLLSPHTDRIKRFLVTFKDVLDNPEFCLAGMMLRGQDLGSQGQRIHPDTFELIDGDHRTTALQLAALNDDLQATKLLLEAGTTKIP